MVKIYNQKWSLSLTNSGPPCFHSGVRYVWQGEICQMISPASAPFRTNLWNKILTFNVTKQPWTLKARWRFSFFCSLLWAFTFWNTHSRKYPQSTVARSYSIHSITYLISLPVSATSSSISQRLFSSTASDIWSYRNLLSTLFYYLTTPRLITDCRTANGKVFKRKYDYLKRKFTLN